MKLAGVEILATLVARDAREYINAHPEEYAAFLEKEVEQSRTEKETGLQPCKSRKTKIAKYDKTKERKINNETS